MNPAARERLLGFSHALDDRAFVLLSFVALGVLALGAAATALLAAMRRLTPDLRRELLRRTASWAVMAPLVYLPIFFGALWTILMVAVLSLACFREFSRATGFFREKRLAAVVALGIVLVDLAALDHWRGLFVALGPLVFILLAAVALVEDRPRGYTQRIGLAALSFLFFGVCLGHLADLANDAGYRPMLLLLLVCVALNDVFAFAVGKAVGGPRLAPATSPNKTASGALGALLLTTAVFTLLGRAVFAGSPMAATPRLVALGAIVSAAGQLGDLTISSVKRDVGIKDMGAIIPGHGGVLDRCNSLLLAAPAVYHFVAYFRGIGLDQPVRLFTGH